MPPAAFSNSDVAGGSVVSNNAAAWGLARVAALEHAGCRWHGADVSHYMRQMSRVSDVACTA
jgi:hypothetical protein